MPHNHTRAFFSNHERAEVKGSWGTQGSRLTRESFLPLAACHLCLQSARDPVACRDGGHLFCRECAVSNLLTQKKEIARLEKEGERRREEYAENEKDKAVAAHEQAVKKFEKDLAGLDADASSSSNKRKHESSADDDRTASRRKVDDQKAPKSSQPFWVPSAIQVAETDRSEKKHKVTAVCPSGPSNAMHPISLKALVPVTFSTSTSASTNGNGTTVTITIDGKSATIVCPACKKGLSSSSRAMLTVPCGHVICKTCSDQFMNTSKPVSTSKHTTPLLEETSLACYVCQTDLTGNTNKDKRKKEGKRPKDKDSLKPGLIELSTRGTGFAGAGQSKVDKDGIAFGFG